MKKFSSILLFLLASIVSVPALSESIASSSVYLDVLSGGEITSVMDCEMDNGVVYTCAIVKFEKQNYVLARDNGEIVGEWILKNEVTTLLWKKEGVDFEK